jgi:hypothetical protein
MTDLESGFNEEKAIALRSAAAECLQSATRQSDPLEFDRLTRHALGLIERARAIQHRRRRAVSGSNGAPVTQDSSPRLRKERPSKSAALNQMLIGTPSGDAEWNSRVRLAGMLRAFAG